MPQQIKVDQINTKWKGTIILGAIGAPPGTAAPFPTSAILLRRPCWIVTNDYLNINGSKNQSKFGEILDDIKKDTVITLTLTYSGALTLTVAQKCLEEFATGLPHHVYPVFDLYGKCERISILHSEPRNGSPINEEVSMPGVVAFAAAGPSGAAAHGQWGVDGGHVPHCEKADLEVHEKETDLSLPSMGSSEQQQQQQAVPVAAVASGSGVATSAM